MSLDKFLRSMFDTQYPALIALATLREEQSVSKAAERLGISQPSMSKLLTGLRRQFNDPIYAKQDNVFTLTQIGESLCAIVRNSLYTSHAMIEQLKSGVKNRYSISLPYWFSINKVAHFIESARNAYPNLVINFTPLMQASSEQLVQNVKRGVIDLAVCHFPYISTHGMNVQKIGQTEFYFLRKKTAVKQDSVLNLSSFLYTPIIIYNVTPYLLNSFMQSNSIDENQLKVVMTLTNNFDPWLNELVADNILLMTLRFSGEQLLVTGDYERVTIENLNVHFPIHLMWHERSAQDPIHQSIRDLMLEMNGQ